MNARTKERALVVLDNMSGIVKREMLVQQSYIDPRYLNQELKDSGAICGGRRACAIGSLWIAGGVKPEMRWGDLILPGIEGEEERREFVKRRPALRAALDALNYASELYIEKNPGVELSRVVYPDMLERLFEGDLGRPFARLSSFKDNYASTPEQRKAARKEMLGIITTAKRIIRKEKED